MSGSQAQCAHRSLLTRSAIDLGSLYAGGRLRQSLRPEVLTAPEGIVRTHSGVFTMRACCIRRSIAVAIASTVPRHGGSMGRVSPHMSDRSPLQIDSNDGSFMHIHATGN